MNLRSLPRVLLAAMVLSFLAAVPASSRPSAAPSSPPRSSPGAQIVRSFAVPASAPPSALCRPGLTTLQFTFGPACIHGGDPLPAPPPTSSKAAREGPVATPKCYGNGENGARIQLIYAYLIGQENRAPKIVPQILKKWVPHIEGIFRQTSKDQGRELGLRFHAPGCLLGVDVVGIPYELGQAKPPKGQQFSNVVQHLYNIGYQDTNKKYLIWLDASSGGSVCGTGMLIGDDSPAVVNLMNGNPGGVVPMSLIGLPPMFAVTFGAGCWGKGSPLAHTETHELLHALGAVQFSAPNSNQAGHCTDASDIMCYPDANAPEELQKLRQVCAQATNALDCGSDDYFAISPAPDSYLATHFNIADSQFLGDALGVDLIPARIPRT